MMTDGQFAAQVEAALKRAADLRRRAGTADGPLARAVLTEALEEMALALEELSVAQEELRVQHEALVSAEALAAAERDRYRDLFEFAPNGYLVTDAEGVVAEGNRAARHLLRVPGPRYLIGKPLSTCVAPADRPALFGQLTALQQGEPQWSQTLRFQPRAEGAGSRVVDVTVVPFRDLETRLPRLRWQLRDVTEEHRAAAEVRAANERLEERVRERTAELQRALAENEALVARVREEDRRKDLFVGVLAHELRNPLAPIRNAVHILKMQEPVDPRTAHAAELIDRQALNLGRLVDDLLDVSRLAQGKVHLSAERLDLRDATDRAVEAVREQARTRGVKLATEAPDEPVCSMADPARLEQVLLNLLTNAVKYTDRGGRVAVAVGREAREGAAGGWAVLRVADTGIGIAPEALSQVFELFVQAEGAVCRSQGGLGIGLHMVKRLVELHGGTVTAHSGGPGQGSEFVVRLPLADTPTCP